MSNDSLTITLTDRPPVKIDKATWPVIAKGKRWDNIHESQANRTWKLLVRRHEDGRAIVYGIYASAYQNENGKRAGEMLEAGADIPAAIYRVAMSLGWEVGPGSVAADAIANLPAEEPASGAPTTTEKTFDITPPALRDPVKAQKLNQSIADMNDATANLLNSLMDALGDGDIGDLHTIKANLAKFMLAEDAEMIMDMIEKRRLAQEAFLAAVAGR